MGNTLYACVISCTRLFLLLCWDLNAFFNLSRAIKGVPTGLCKTCRMMQTVA